MLEPTKKHTPHPRTKEQPHQDGWRDPIVFNQTSYLPETLGGHKQNLVCSRTQETGAVSPQGTEPYLPVSVLKSLVKSWIDSGLLCDQEHRQQQCWETQYAGINSFRGGCHYPYHSLGSGQTIEKEHSPTHQQKIGLKIY